jgi:SAM-dependent methyltransferase
MSTRSGYLFDTASTAGGLQVDALADLYDPTSQRRILSLLDLRGKRCLEIGAGSGRIAHWLANEVGPGGKVVATDLHPDRIPEHPRLERLRHDITRQVPPDGPWDFIYLRFVLSHLRPRRHILTQLAGSLAPGGVILDEDWESRPAEHIVAKAPTEEDAELLVAYQRAMHTILARNGHDQSWARQVYGLLVDAGLEDVDTQVSSGIWVGDTPGCWHAIATITQTRSLLIEAGMTDAQLDRVVARLSDPAVALHARLLHSTSGRRAAS